MNCPTCNSTMQRDVRDVTHTYKNNTITIKQVHGHFCPICGFMVADENETERMAKLKLRLYKQVNGLLGDVALIERVRLKLHLTQKDASHIFGGGINAFSRYETGRTTPPPSLVLLFKLLDAHPDMLLTELSQYVPSELRRKLRKNTV